jgi:hypothetical protein
MKPFTVIMFGLLFVLTYNMALARRDHKAIQQFCQQTTFHPDCPQ